MNLTLGMIGLGRMGGNMSRRLARAGHTVIAWDRSPEARSALHDESRIVAADTLESLVSRLPAPRVLWLMLPAGAPTADEHRSCAGRHQAGGGQKQIGAGVGGEWLQTVFGR